MGYAKSFTNEHVAWLMQWKSTVPRNFVGKAIQHQVTSWADYKPNHYEDLVRIALEAQPAAVIATLQESSTSADQKDFLSKLVVPRLDEQFALLAAGNFTVENLKDLKTKKLVFSNLSTPKFLKLAKKYMAAKTPQEQVKEVLDYQLKLNKELNAILAPSIATLLKSTEAADQELYLKTAIYMNTLPGLKEVAAAEKYLTDIQAKNPDVLPLAINTFIKVKKSKFAFYKGLIDSTTDIAKAYAYLGALETASKKKLTETLTSLKAYNATLAQADKAKLYTTLAEYPRSLMALFITLEDASVKDIDDNFDILFFAKERYAATVKSAQLRKLSQTGYKNVSKKLKTAQAVKDRKIQHKRWEKVAKTNKGNLETGKIMFQALCLSCHKFQGKGQGIAPVLDGTGNRPLDGLISAIVNPDEGVESVYTKTHVQLHNGQHLSGLLKKEEGQNYMYQMGGGKMLIPASDISYIFGSARSFMPDFITKGLGDEQLGDLLKYLRSMK